MNEQAKQEKLQDLERRQRDIADEIQQLLEADEIQQLREAEKEHEPEAGDVYTDGCDTFYYSSNQVVLPLILSVGCECTVDRIKHDNITYLGKFSDVYITKERVREILSHADSTGDSIMDFDGMIDEIAIRAIRADLRAEGILTE